MDESSKRDESLFRVLRDVVSLFTPRERRQVAFLLPAFVFTALMQVVGIASVLPFLSLVSNPDRIHSNHLIARVYTFLGSPGETRFLVFTGIAALVIMVLSNVIIATTQWFVLRFTWSTNHALSQRLLERYLAKPYEFFLNENSSALVKNMLSEVRQVVSGLLMPGLNFISSLFVALAIMGLLVVWNPVLALASFALLGGAYGGFFMAVRKRLRRIGRSRARAAGFMYRSASEALAGAKEIKLLGRERTFIRRYGRHSKRFSRVMTQQNLIAQLPRYALEVFAFGSLILIVVMFLAIGNDLDTILPVLGLYAAATYRLLPALQSIFNAMSSIRFSTMALSIVKNDLQDSTDEEIDIREGLEPMTFRRAVELRGVTYSYPGAKGPVFERFDLSIPANSVVAFVGATGSGKTTTADLLLGLLRPNAGMIFVDDEPLDDDVKVLRWQRNLGYVPQTIFLTDDTVAHNIAFGLDRDAVDMAAVERAARMANIHDFIVDQLPAGYDTVVGERGIRLSGGQRQRLGIARALYTDPDVLVLDEATSALDSVTEEAIFGAVNEIAKSKTIVMIAHRITTVRNSDIIYLMEKGRVLRQGTFDDLLATSPEFRALAQVDGEHLEALRAAAS